VFTARYVLHSVRSAHTVYLCVDLRTNSDYFPTQREMMEKTREETGKGIERHYIYIITGVERQNVLFLRFQSATARPFCKGRLNTKHCEMKKARAAE
jgi:hypothetical protein